MATSWFPRSALALAALALAGCPGPGPEPSAVYRHFGAADAPALRQGAGGLTVGIDSSSSSFAYWNAVTPPARRASFQCCS